MNKFLGLFRNGGAAGTASRNRPRGGLGRLALQISTVIAAACVLLVAVRVVLAAPTYAGPISVTANMDNFSPSVVAVNSPATAGLSAYYTPPSGTPEGQLSASYDWSVSQVQYKALQADAFGAPPANSYTDSISPTQPSASSGATLTFTPEIAGYWQVSTSCSVTVTDTTTNQYWTGSGNDPKGVTGYTFNITYTGSVAGSSFGDTAAVVTGKTIDVHAGWPISVDAALAPSDLASQFTWTVAGAGGNGSAAIGGHNPTTGDTHVVPLNPAADTSPSSPGPSGQYYYIQSGNFAVSVVPQGGSIPSASTTFNVTEPSMAVNTVTGTVAFDNKDPALIPPAMHDGLAEIINGVPAVGIKFVAAPQLPTAYAGNPVWVQIYDPTDIFKNAAGQTFTRNTAGLDTSMPYGADTNLGDHQYATDDSPGISTALINNMVSMDIADAPKIYLLYSPATYGSIDVPIQKVAWSWSGTATLANGAWATAGLANAPNPAGVDIDSEPEWDGLAQSLAVQIPD